MKFIDRLFDGPIDIVGDIHGEVAALDTLLGRLGYASDGAHAGGRRLVFVGDLVDRGPDSPAVLARVQALVTAGRAQCILGNHELNLLRNEEKLGNSWWVKPEAPTEHPTQRITPEAKAGFIAWLETLPLALERNDLRVVHASWNAASIEALRREQRDGESVVGVYRRNLDALLERWRGGELSQAYRAEWLAHGERLTDPDWTPVLMPAKAQMDSEFQMRNPIVVLTSGEETPTDQPFWAGGRWRMVDRVQWWNTYNNATPVVIGHYWRRYSEARLELDDKFGPDVFAGIEPHHWMGTRNNVYCVDFSVGARAEQRANEASTRVCSLAALRVPEWQVVHDDGERWDIGPPGLVSDTNS